jgi:hypothetical protein
MQKPTLVISNKENGRPPKRKSQPFSFTRSSVPDSAKPERTAQKRFAAH